EAKRLYGIIGSGGTASTIVVGLSTGAIALNFGANALLIFCALLTLGCASASAWVGREGRQRLTSGGVQPRHPRGLHLDKGTFGIAQPPSLRTFAIFVALFFVPVTLLDFDFKVFSARTSPPDLLAFFFGIFYAATGVLGLGLQVLGTRFLLSAIGV